MGCACTCHAAGSYSGLGAEAEPGDWATAAAAIAWTWPSGGAGRGLKVLCMDVAAAAAARAPGVLQGARLPMVHASWGGGTHAMCHAAAATLLPVISAVPAPYSMEGMPASGTPKGWHIGGCSLIDFCLLCRKTRRRLLKAVLTGQPCHQATLRSPHGQPRP